MYYFSITFLQYIAKFCHVACMYMSHIRHIVREHTAFRSVLADSGQVLPNSGILTYLHGIKSLRIITGLRTWQIPLLALAGVSQNTFLNNKKYVCIFYGKAATRVSRQ